VCIVCGAKGPPMGPNGNGVEFRSTRRRAKLGKVLYIRRKSRSAPELRDGSQAKRGSMCTRHLWAARVRRGSAQRTFRSKWREAVCQKIHGWRDTHLAAAEKRICLRADGVARIGCRDVTPSDTRDLRFGGSEERKKKAGSISFKRFHGRNYGRARVNDDSP